MFMMDFIGLLVDVKMIHKSLVNVSRHPFKCVDFERIIFEYVIGSFESISHTIQFVFNTMVCLSKSIRVNSIITTSNS